MCETETADPRGYVFPRRPAPPSPLRAALTGSRLFLRAQTHTQRKRDEEREGDGHGRTTDRKVTSITESRTGGMNVHERGIYRELMRLRCLPDSTSKSSPVPSESLTLLLFSLSLSLLRFIFLCLISLFLSPGIVHCPAPRFASPLSLYPSRVIIERHAHPRFFYQFEIGGHSFRVLLCEDTGLIASNVLASRTHRNVSLIRPGT